MNKHLEEQRRKAIQLHKLNSEDITDVEIIDKAIRPQKTNKFKVLIASAAAKINPKFINTNNTLEGLSYIIGYKVANLHKDFKISAIEIFNGLRVVGGSVSFYINKSQDKLFFIAQKAVIFSERNNINNGLKKLGLNFETLLDPKTQLQLSEEQLKNTVLKGLKDVTLNEHGSIDLLENDKVDSAIKIDIVKHMIWPKIKKEIQESVSLFIVGDKLLKMDKHFKELEKFAADNNMSINSIIYLINHPKEHLKELKQYSKIEKNLDDIIRTYNKYSEYSNANYYISQFYISIMEKVMDKYLPPAEKEAIVNEQFFSIGDQGFNFNDLKAKLSLGNVEKIKPSV